jgi:hypothetical protein
MENKLMMKNKPFSSDKIIVADITYASTDDLIAAGWVIA